MKQYNLKVDGKAIAPKKTIAELASSGPEIKAGTLVCLGLDVHANQITVVRQIDHSLPQPAQRFTQEKLLHWVEKMLKQGAQVWSCYEAGCFGYGLHRSLCAMGANNLVVAPEAWSGRNKTDKHDAREMCLELERYVAGNKRAFSVVYVPTEAQERAREAGRQRGRILKERIRSERRGASLLTTAGIKAPSGWWKPKTWAELKSTLDEDLAERVSFWQEQAIVYQRKQLQARKCLEEEAISEIPTLPAGIGKLTWRLLCGEIFTWKRFQNRRQIGSFTGLCPSEDSTGDKRKQGSINRHGNPRVRHLLIEAVWRLTHFEPGWRGFKKFPELLDKEAGSRKRKRLAVAAARLLAIDLWRLETGQTNAISLGFRAPNQ
jgi:transposase